MQAVRMGRDLRRQMTLYLFIFVINENNNNNTEAESGYATCCSIQPVIRCDHVCGLCARVHAQ